MVVTVVVTVSVSPSAEKVDDVLVEDFWSVCFCGCGTSSCFVVLSLYGNVVPLFTVFVA